MADVPENAPERKILCIFPFSLRDLKNWPLRFFLSDLIYFSSILTDCPGTGSEQAGKGTACQGCPNQNICSSSKPLGPDPGNLIAFRSNIKLILNIAVMKISFFPISSGEMKNWKLCIYLSLLTWLRAYVVFPTDRGWPLHHFSYAQWDRKFPPTDRHDLMKKVLLFLQNLTAIPKRDEK